MSKLIVTNPPIPFFCSF